MNEIIETPTLTSASFEDLAREMLVRLGEDPESRRPAEDAGALCQGACST